MQDFCMCVRAPGATHVCRACGYDPLREDRTYRMIVRRRLERLAEIRQRLDRPAFARLRDPGNV